MKQEEIDAEVEDYVKFLDENSFLKMRSINLYATMIKRFLRETHITKEETEDDKALLEKANHFLVRLLKHRNLDFTRDAIKHYFIFKGKKHLTLDIVKIPRQQKKRIPPELTEKQINQVIEELSEPYKTVAIIQKYTGARAAMVLSLSYKRIHVIKKPVPMIEVTMLAKGMRNDKLIPARILNKQAVKHVIDFLEKAPKYDWAFPFMVMPQNPMPLWKILRNNYLYYWRELNRVRKKLNLKIGTHDFRRFFIYKFYEISGHDINATRLAVHHSKLETTALYLEAYHENVFKTLQKLQKRMSLGDDKNE